MIQVTDGANTDTITVTVTVQDLNDETPAFTSSGTPSINENVRNVLTLAASDTDAGDSATFAITGGADSELFEIDGGTTLRFAAAAGANYESPGDAGTNNEYVVVVTATDTGANAVAQTITITIQDVNEFSPVFGDGDTATATPNENQQAVGTYAATAASSPSTPPPTTRMRSAAATTAALSYSRSPTGPTPTRSP